MNCNIKNFRGSVSVVGPGLDQYILKYTDEISLLQQKYQFNPIQCPYHITLVSKEDRHKIPEILNSEISNDEIVDIGIGGNIKKKNFFLILVWPRGQKILKQSGLPPKNFHITLSYQNFEDDTINHRISSILCDIEDKIAYFSSRQINFLLYQLTEIEKNYATALEIAYKLYLQEPSDEILLQAGDIHFFKKNYKLANLFYITVYDRIGNIQNLKNKIMETSNHVETFDLFFSHELDELLAIPSNIRDILIKPKSQTPINTIYSKIDYIRSENLTNLTSKKRLYTIESREMPRFFSTLIPDFIGLMSSPRNSVDIVTLTKLSFQYIITLTGENPLPSQWFNQCSIENIFIPVADGKAPTIHEMNWIIQFLTTAFLSNKRVIIHCGGGKGRVGTIAACYLALFSTKPPISRGKPIMSAGEAINMIRQSRPGSIETLDQEHFVSEWVSHCWKYDTVSITEPHGESLDIFPNEQFLSKSNLIVLVGLPGSGKSWLAAALKKQNPDLFNIISRDNLQDKTDLSSLINSNKRNIIDQCNVDRKSRKKWLIKDLHPIAITWKCQPELCQQRISQRLNHPTIPIYGGGKAIKDCLLDWNFPELEEGFKSVVTIKTFENSKEIIRKICPSVSVPKHKFPRTFHAINLGAASRDDLVMSKSSLQEIVSCSTIIVEEKIDGANLGLSLSGFDLKILAQNRGHYVNKESHLQFKNLERWISSHYKDLLWILNRDFQYPERYILYGEWMALKHSIHYNNLPDVFIAFDLYDKLDDIWYSRCAISDILRSTSIHQVPFIARYPIGHIPNLQDLINTPSKFTNGPVEGVYLRFQIDTEMDACFANMLCETGGRAKVVRSDFLTSNTHWKNSQPVYNQFI